MNRTDFQKVANVRVKEAKVLINKKCFDGAYYLLGYAVECALKSCISKQIRKHDFPEKKLIDDAYTHELDKLLNLTGLKRELEQTGEVNSNWAIVKDWSVSDRYKHGIAESKARDYLDAVTAEDVGVLSWLKKYW